MFDRFRQAGVKLAPKKCSFFRNSLKFLGHIITGEGVATDPEKISAVQKWPLPTTITEMRSFLGFCNYYRKFIKNYSTLTAALEDLIKETNMTTGKGKKEVMFWQDNHKAAFTTLKSRLCTTPVLSFPNCKDEFILDTDASHDGIGAVLSQLQNGSEKVIAYASKKLTKCQKSYCVTRKELLAVYVFVTQFRHYLLGKKFHLRTDHKSLTWMLNWERPNTSQYCSWIAELEVYDFVIEHRKGVDHINGDALSRLPACQQCILQGLLKQRDRKLSFHANLTTRRTLKSVYQPDQTK